VRIYLFLFLLGFAAPLHAQATASEVGPSPAQYAAPFYTCVRNYYVSPTGNDANAGTSAAPWLTIQHADTAAGGRVAGDCVNVEPGTYPSGSSITHSGNAATATGYVVYRCTQLDACTITESDHGFQIFPPGARGTGDPGPDFVVIDGFELAAISEVGFGQGIAVEDNESPENSFGSHHIWVLNNLIHGYGQSGVQMNDGEYFYVLHNTIYNNANVSCGAQGSGISLSALKAASGYTPTAMDTAWGFRNVVEFNESYNNTLTQCGTASNPYNTDGNGIIFDTWDGSGTTFGPYAGSALAATEVSPRRTPLASVKVTKRRLTAGKSATVSLPVTKIPKLGAALGGMSVVTLGAGVATQAPLVGSVWQIVRVTGRPTVLVFAAAVIIASIPRLTVATARTPVPLAPEIST